MTYSGNSEMHYQAF